MTEVVCGPKRGPGGTVGSLQILLGTAGTGQQEVTELSLSYLLNLKREGRVVGTHQDGDINLVLAVILIGPGVLSSFVSQNILASGLSHHEDITERVAVAVEIILDLLRVSAVKYFPGVGLGSLQSVAQASQDRDQAL